MSQPNTIHIATLSPGCAVVPIALCITWKKANGTGAVVGAVVGFAAAIAGWIGITARLNDGVINVTTTFGDYEMLTGNLLSIGIGGIITVLWSVLRPENFDWEVSRGINRKVQGRAVGGPTIVADGKGEGADSGADSPPLAGSNKEKNNDPSDPAAVDPEEQTTDEEENIRGLKKAFRFSSYAAIALTIILLIVIPLPLFFSHHVYPKAGFTAWIAISIIWLFCGLIAAGLMPIWEARRGLKKIALGVMGRNKIK